jgi:hypothetical protein
VPGRIGGTGPKMARMSGRVVHQPAGVKLVAAAAPPAIAWIPRGVGVTGRPE